MDILALQHFSFGNAQFMNRRPHRHNLLATSRSGPARAPWRPDFFAVPCPTNAWLHPRESIGASCLSPSFGAAAEPASHGDTN
ncbi:hypothetical protein QM996_09950 [Sinorhizobium chiapasense]